MGLVGGGGYIVVCFICGHVYGCCKCPCRFCLGVRLRGGGVLVGVYCFGITVVGGWGVSFWFS